MFIETSRPTRGLLIALGGITLLLYTLNLFQYAISFILITVALGAIVYGLQVSGLYEKIRNLIFKK